jgi:hypothetical protein
VSAGGWIPTKTLQEQSSPFEAHSLPFGVQGVPMPFSLPALGGHPGGKSPKEKSRPTKSCGAASWFPLLDEHVAVPTEETQTANSIPISQIAVPLFTA